MSIARLCAEARGLRLTGVANENVRTFEAGDLIFNEGEAGDLMYVLLEGVVELKMKVEGAETLLKTVDTPNDIFGEMALIDERPRSASAVAAKRTRLLVVDGPTFESMILANGKFALRIIKVLAARIRRSNDQMTELIETLPKERMARGMVDFGLRHGEMIHDGGVKVSVEALKAWLNSHLGASMGEIEASIYRFLKDGTIAWAPTSAKTKENLVLPADFVKANDRRSQERPPQ
jgi:CRP/FNR family transcriptional regulator, cyclic AMP receptor protein